MTTKSEIMSALQSIMKDKKPLRFERDLSRGFYDDDAGTSVSAFSAAYHFARFMEALGFPPEADDLVETPARVALMYREMFTPESYEPTTFESKTKGMVILRDVPFGSICAHHFLPYMGVASVGYLPFRGKVIGISKIARAIAFESAAPTIQETLTHDILKRVSEETGSPDVIVTSSARHTCMEIRGAKSSAETITTEFSGAFEQLSTRLEFVDMLRGRL